MLRPFVNIKIQQVPDSVFPDRNRLIELDFVSSYEISQTWEKHTDTCIVKLPKNIVLQSDEFLFKQSGTYNAILGGVDKTHISSTGFEIKIPPLIKSGDIIYIQDGYFAKNQQYEDIQLGSTVFYGYIRTVKSETPIELECEDNFYLLKHIPVNKSIWKGNLVDLCKYMLDQTNKAFGQNSLYEINGVNPYPILEFTDTVDSITADFSLGHLVIGNITCSQLLNELRSNYHLDSFFVGNKLHFGFPIYVESESDKTAFFEFENNIFPDCNLEYKDKNDIVLSAVVSCKVINKVAGTTHDGKDKTKKERLSILVYWDLPTSTWKYIKHEKGEKFPDNEGGERRDFKFPVDLSEPAPTVEKLFEFGVNQLKKYFYSGFRGSFKTFGFPFVKFNDNVNIISNVFADRNGQYKVKKVIRRGGEGIEQEIFLDYKVEATIPEYTELYLI